MKRFPNSLCLALGLASATGFAPLGIWPVTLVALAAMMHLVAQAPTLKSALARGYGFGIGHFALGLNWIAGSFRFQDAMPIWLGWIAVVGLALFLATYPAMAAGLAWRWGKDKHLPFILFFAAAWTITEYLRASLFTGFAWNPLGVIFVGNLVDFWGQYVGTYGLGALVILIAGALWMLAMKQWRSLVTLGVPFALLVFGAGQALMVGEANELARMKAEARQPLLQIVQPNIGQGDKHDSSYDAKNFATLERLTGIPGAEPRLILWPEAAIPDFLEEEEWARERVASLLGPKDLLLTGASQLIYGKDDKLTGAHNSVFAVTPEAKLAGRYDKSHLVPGGEYLPLRWLMEPLGATRLVPGDIDFHEGPGPRTLDLRQQGFGGVGVQICYEIIFSGHVVDLRPYARPTFIFNPSNDAWFGSWGPPQHLAQARLRAVEEGLPVIRSTPTGISAVIDADGRVRESLPYQKAGAISARLPPAYAPTPFARYGNILPLGFAILLTLIGIASRRRLG